MLPSREKILKRNAGFKELVLSCFGSCVEQEHKRVKPLTILAAEHEVMKANGQAEPTDGWYELPVHEERLFNWIIKQVKTNTFIEPTRPLEARAHHVEAVLALFNDEQDDEIVYVQVEEGKQPDLNNYVDWDKSKPIIMKKIIDSEYLFGLAY